MNVFEYDILKYLKTEEYTSQRVLAKECRQSLGCINKSLKSLIEAGYINMSDYTLTSSAMELISSNSPERAVILAAGYGMRMIPLNRDISKGLLTVKGETLIERLICQLHEAGIREIYIVVGYMKESYEYIIDKYGVNLIYNPEYKLKNNIYSLACAADYMKNAYIIPCDIWCNVNPFCKIELYSWYMLYECSDENSFVKVNRKKELVKRDEDSSGREMSGICYLNADSGKELKDIILRMCESRKYDKEFWETAVFQPGAPTIYEKCCIKGDVTEINTYEQLREFDENSLCLNSDAITVISKVFKTEKKYIKDISVLKKGMTNRSFVFRIEGRRYIMRIPGEGTSRLINRHNEVMVYEYIKKYRISDDVIFISPDSGYKITGYIENARNCNSENWDDVKKCMEKLREFHNLHLVVDAEFNLFRMIEFYENIRNNRISVYKDYEMTRRKIFRLKKYIEKYACEYTLVHIDSVADNFLIYEDESGKENIRLIDWEYAAMQDPHVDIAMFAIYSFYDRSQVDKLINIYFDNQKCDVHTRIKIYCYIAVCGLLWSNWCEYKAENGYEFGEYSIRQFRYAKEYYNIVCENLKEIGEALYE